MAGSIVCGVDNSTDAQHAIVVAAELAEDLARPLRLVHVVAPRSRAPRGDRSERERGRHSAWEQMQSSLFGLRHGYPRVEATARIEVGNPAIELARVAEAERAQLVVVGSRGWGRVGSAFLGSVSSSLERRSPCPVVVIPARAPMGAEDHRHQKATIVCGIADPDSEAVLVEFAAGLAAALQTRLELVHADRWDVTDLTPAIAASSANGGAADGDPGLRRLKSAVHLADAQGVRVDARLAPGPPARALDRVAGREGARLIVIGGRRKRGPLAALRRSVARELVTSGSTPVLIVPRRALQARAASRRAPANQAHEWPGDSGSGPCGAAG